MLETFQARLGAAVGVAEETGQDAACPCIVFPEISGSEAVRDVINGIMAAMGESLAEASPEVYLSILAMGGVDALGHALTTAAAAGYALALDSQSAISFDVEDVDWDSLPLDTLGDN